MRNFFRPTFLPWFLFLLLPTLCSSKRSPYLYHSLENDGGQPIIDYSTPENEHPDFLYQEDFPVHRVVEFYSHTCPHCQRFAPQYIEFGKNFNALTEKHTSGHYAGLQVDFYAISCMQHRAICKQQKIRSYPSVKIFRAGSNEGIKIPYYELHPETLVKKLGIEAVNDNWKVEEESENKAAQVAQQSTSQDKPPFMARRSAELFADAYLSFHTAMKTAVFLDDSNRLGDDKKKALHQWLTLLQRVLPPWKIHPLLDALLGGPTQNFTASIETEQAWMNILDHYPPTTTEYSPACQLHESPYTCGLWTLFHIVSVGVVEFNAVIVNEGQFYLDLESVAKMVRNFVQHLLLCQACTDHFLQEFDNCSYDRCTRFKKSGALDDWKQFPFWLLETHNGVNVRLQWERAGEQARTTEQQQSVLWPSVSECPGCWLETQGALSAQRYNHTSLYNYLRLTYWPEDTESVATRQDLMLRLQTSSNRDSTASLGTSAAVVNPESTERSKDTTTTATTAQVTHHSEERVVETSDGNPFSAKLSVVAKEIQYSVGIMLLVVLIVWNRKRIRLKRSARTV